jgi:bifunctional pyridoxal-dependent enzyme with beta-cystathionase and maltose regulon repressor activities
LELLEQATLPSGARRNVPAARRQLPEVGGLEWSLYPDKIGAFVADMDFGIPPPVAQAIDQAVSQGVFG